LWPRLIVAALLVVGYLFLKQLLPLTARGRKIHDQIALWIPGVGRLWRERAVSRFLLALSSLTNAGLTAPAALEACKGIADNAVLDERLEIVAQNARRANLPLPEALSQTGLLSNNALRLIKTGERSGASPEMLLRAANEYDQNLQNGLTSVPKIIGVSVFVVCGIATAVILGLALNLLYSNMFIGVEKYMEMK
jgi:type IV pilus assembly protein PilC